MSYKITCYFNDPNITTTQIDIVWGESYTRGYNAATLEVYADMPVTFTATSTTGNVTWVYRVGSISSAAQEISTNPFTYEGEQDIWIRATSSGGGGGGGSWTSSSIGSYTVTTSGRIVDFNGLGGTTTQYAAITFSDNGTATFTGARDVYFYLSTDTSFNTSNGKPNNQVATDESYAGFSYTVSKNTTYYLWARVADPNYMVGTYTEITLMSGSVTTGSGFYIYTSSGWKKATPYIYSGGTWVKCKPCIYTSSGWIRGK